MKSMLHNTKESDEMNQQHEEYDICTRNNTERSTQLQVWLADGFGIVWINIGEGSA